jgi:hypothetical protein
MDREELLVNLRDFRDRMPYHDTRNRYLLSEAIAVLESEPAPLAVGFISDIDAERLRAKEGDALLIPFCWNRGSRDVPVTITERRP